MITAVQFMLLQQKSMELNGDPNCRINAEIIGAAHRLSYDQPVTDITLHGAAKVYLSEYKPDARKAQKEAYYAPHIPGKPERYYIQYQCGEFEGLPCFS